MNTKHTPGPWVVAPKPVGSFGKNWVEIHCQRRPVVHCGSYEKTQHGETWTECGVVINEANARLIAGSPSLYDFVLNRSEQGDAEALNLLISLNLYDHAEDA